MSAAENACRHSLPGASGPQVSGTQQQQAVSRLVRYAQCMRAHGMPNFPDPTPGNGGMGFNLSGVDQNSRQDQTAQHACHSLQSRAKGQSSAGGGS